MENRSSFMNCWQIWTFLPAWHTVLFLAFHFLKQGYYYKLTLTIKSIFKKYFSEQFFGFSDNKTSINLTNPRPLFRESQNVFFRYVIVIFWLSSKMPPPIPTIPPTPPIPPTPTVAHFQTQDHHHGVGSAGELHRLLAASFIEAQKSENKHQALIEWLFVLPY